MIFLKKLYLKAKDLIIILMIRLIVEILNQLKIGGNKYAAYSVRK
jgi:hypothetical protein